MILIADSGSTKTKWCVDGGRVILSEGINPYYQTEEQIKEAVAESFVGVDVDRIAQIYFYGAGCNNADVNTVVEQALQSVFNNADVSVNSDLLGAARSVCQSDKGIACILGTGSNSCFYNGRDIVKNVSPLGFILGDEGSGAVLGRRFIGDLLKNQLSDSLTRRFYQQYGFSYADILTSVYKKEFPNRFLAQFTKFMNENINCPQIECIVRNEFKSFLERNVLQYDNAKKLPINFVGSIAFHFRSILEDEVKKLGLYIGRIEKEPILGLVGYHIDASC
ncbi:MAG: BadF/BadG/BcrA/BcrD ATPase family protein [Bacteroidales bacterium]